MKHLIILALLFSTLSSSAQNKNAKASLDVNGICGMCKARIEKACLNTKGVKWADWNVETHELKLIYNAQKISIDSIKQSVLTVGHDVEDNTATAAAYASVHPCCKYRNATVRNEHQD